MKRKLQDIDIEFRTFLEKLYPGATFIRLSDSNNQVVKLKSGGQTVVVKKIVDVDIPIEYMNKISRLISRDIPTQEVIRVFRQAEGAPFDCVVSSYIDGIDMANVIDGKGEMPTVEKLTKFLMEFMTACSNLPRLIPNFALYKVGAKQFSSQSEFLLYYTRKYWQRVQHLISDESVRRWMEHWIRSGIAHAMAGSEYQTVAIDVNLRNYIVQHDGSLALLNVPIVGWSSRAHAVACISVHYRNHPFRTKFLNVATKGFSLEEISAIEYLELWYLLGILSFYVTKNTKNPSRWCNWGASIPLLKDFSSLVKKLAVQLP